MQNLIPAVNALTMSSLDLVDFINAHRKQQAERAGEDFVELQHKHFLAKVLVVLGAETSANFSADLPDSYGRSRAGYKFPKRESCLMAMSYSYDLQAAVFDHMSELEKQLSSPAIPQSLPEALRLAADLAEQNQVLAIENKQQAGKIACMENLFKPGMTVTQFCKGLNGVNVMLVSSALESRHWLFNESKSSTRWRVGSYARDRYMTEEQIEITPHGSEPFIQYKPVLLKKGAARLYELYLSEELPMKKAWDGRFTHDKALQGAA